MSLIFAVSTVCRSSDKTTKSASLPGVIEPLIASSREAYAPLIVLIRSASSTLIRWLAPHVSPFHPVRVTMP